MILWGIRSPITVEIEESCHRLGIPITAAVSINGQPRLFDQSKVISLEEWHLGTSEEPFFVCAFTPSRRQELIGMAREEGLTLADAVVDPHAILARTVRIGSGTFINAGAIIGAMSVVGEGVMLNRAASVGHHTVLGDFVSIGPGANLAGNIHIGAGSMIGAGATVLPNMRIGVNAIVAAGSLVREHVSDNTFVAGNPAKARTFDPARSSLHVEDGE